MAADVSNYYLGKGKLTWTEAGGSATARDLGNVPEFELTPEVEKLDHFSSREGVRKKDKSVTISQTLTVRIVMEEYSLENLAMVMLGTVTTNTLEIFSKSTVEGQLDFEGTNDVGPKATIVLYNVSFSPGSSLSLITDEWGQIELTGEALVATSGANAGKFGLITWEAGA